MAEENISKGKKFGEFLVGRIRKPFSHPEFIMYFIFFIVVIGAIDIWSTIYLLNQSNVSEYQHLRVSIFGFAFVLISTASVDLMFSDVGIISRIVRLSAIILVVLGVAVFLILFNSNSGWSFFVAILWAVISLFVWWIANAENTNIIGKDFFDEMGDKTRELGESLSDFEHE